MSTASSPTIRPTTPPVLRAIRGRLVLVVVLSLVEAVMRVLPYIGLVELARALWPALDGGSVDAGRAWTAVALALAALVLGVTAGIGAGLMSHLADGRMQLDLRGRIVEHVRRLPLGWLDDHSSGAVKKIVENDVSALHQLIAHSIRDVITAVAVPVLSLVYLFSADWRLALFSMVPLVATGALYPVMLRGSTEKYAQFDRATVGLNAATIEFVQGISVVKTFGLAGRSHGRYREQTSHFSGFYGSWMREAGVVVTIMELIASPVVVLGYLCGVSLWMVSALGVVPVDVLPVLLLGIGLTAPLQQLGYSSQHVRMAVRARASLAEFFALAPLPRPSEPQTPTSGGIELETVGFGYDSEHLVLHDVLACCIPGTVTALVGPSGSGKSSLARLVPRFYDTTTGRVSVGDADVRQIPTGELYRSVGFVFQDAYLLRTSIRDNIRLTRPEASQHDVEEAARAAQIHDRIAALARGYDTVVGEEVRLSGGEAQRLTIARAVLTDAPVLVLDEATAFADPDSEAAIQRALSTLAAGRTLLVIAHRLHTITGADQILVLDGGRVVERGDHQQLLEQQGLYHRMWAQYSSAVSSEVP